MTSVILKRALRTTIRLQTFVDDDCYTSCVKDIIQIASQVMDGDVTGIQILTEQPLSQLTGIFAEKRIRTSGYDAGSNTVITDAGHAIRNHDIPENVFGVGCIIGSDGVFIPAAVIVTMSGCLIKSNLAEASGVLIGRFLAERLGMTQARFICDCALRDFFGKSKQKWSVDIIHPSQAHECRDLHMMSHCLAGLYRIPRISEMSSIAVTALLDDLMTQEKRGCVEKFFVVKDYALQSGQTRLDERMVEIRSTRHVKPLIRELAQYSDHSDGPSSTGKKHRRPIQALLKNAKTQQILFRGAHSVSGAEAGADINHAAVITSFALYKDRISRFLFVAAICCIVQHGEKTSRYALIFRCTAPIAPTDLLLSKVADAYGCLLAHRFMPNASVTLHSTNEDLATYTAICKIHDPEGYISKSFGRIKLQIAPDTEITSGVRLQAKRLCHSVLNATRGGSNIRRAQDADGLVRVLS